MKTFPCIAVFMSSLTIMAIAVDRYRMIVYSHLCQVGPCLAWLLLPVIATISSALAATIWAKTQLLSLYTILVRRPFRVISG